MNQKKLQKIGITWIEGIRLDAEEDGFIQKSWETKYQNVVVSSVKRYYNCLYLLAKLSPCARNLMDYLSETMDKDNLVRSSEHDRLAFIGFMSEITSEEINYGHQVVKNAYTELADKNLLLRKHKGLYKVNELYFFKGSDAKRIKSIRLQIEIGSGKNSEDFRFMENRIINI